MISFRAVGTDKGFNLKLLYSENYKYTSVSVLVTIHQPPYLLSPASKARSWLHAGCGRHRWLQLEASRCCSNTSPPPGTTLPRWHQVGRCCQSKLSQGSYPPEVGQPWPLGEKGQWAGMGAPLCNCSQPGFGWGVWAVCISLQMVTQGYCQKELTV